MFAEQRRYKILRLLDEYKEVDVNSLTNILSVSEATVRRDLENLEREGKLRRTHGGAILEDSAPLHMFAGQETKADYEEVKTIGGAAAQYISNGDIIAVSAGDIGVSIVKALPPDMSLTVITNSVDIMLAAVRNKNVRIIFLGGVARISSDNKITVAGEFTWKMLENLHIDKAFIEPDGIHKEAGVTIDDYESSLLFSCFQKVADETVIIAKSLVFNKKKLIKILPCLEIDCIFSSKEVDSEYKSFFFHNGIPLHIGYGL